MPPARARTHALEPVANARAWVVSRLKRWREQVDNKELRQARGLVRAMRTAPPDVLCFGDSTWVFQAPGDVDRRGLKDMLAADLGPAVSVRAVIGAGYHPGLIDPLLGLLAAYPARPVLVIPLCARMHTRTWHTHPVYSYERASRVIKDAPVPPSGRDLLARVPRPGPAELAAHGALEIVTVAGRSTIGEARAPLKDPEGHDLTALERERLLYAFHHGESVDEAALETLRQLGRTVRDLQCPVVLFETPVPIERAEEHWGADMRALVTANFQRLREAVREGYGSELAVIDTGLAFSSSEFIDPSDATEHLNEHGRRRLAELIAGEVRRALGERTG